MQYQRETLVQPNGTVLNRELLNWNIGIDIYTLLYMQWITNNNLLYSTGNSAQYPVMGYMEKESKKERIYVYL